MEQKSLKNLEFEKVLALVASYAGSNAAREELLTLEPVSDAEKISRDHSEIEEFLDYSEAGIKFNIGGIRDLRDIFELLETRGCILESDEFLKVKANIEVASGLKKTLSSGESGYVIKSGNRIAEKLHNLPALTGLKQRIDDCIDDKGEVPSSASPVLAAIRREFSQTVAGIEKQLNGFINKHSDDVQDKFFTIRNERYVLPIQASAQSRIQGIVHDQSSTGQTLFIEPLEFLPINNRLAQLKLSEKEEIKNILRQLTALIHQSLGSLKYMFETLTWLDRVRAKSRFAAEYGATRPELTKKDILILKNARHPLLHPDCVPLDIQMNFEKKIVVITGPNGGGKTVALKMVGINALLAQTGNFVLADTGATLPVFTQILADIGESQSIENHLSTFTAHLKRLKEILDLCSEISLVLIDEICVGTDPSEGSALASGFLKELLARKAFSIVTSHYDSLKNTAFTTPGFTNAAMEFDYENFRPTFRFQMGLPGRSNALSMARAYGIPESVLQDLVNIDSQEQKKEKELLKAIERERSRAEALRRTWVSKISSLRSKEKEIEETLEKLREFRRSKRDKQTEEFIADYRNKLRQLEKLICKLKKEQTQKETEKLQKQQQSLKEARDAHKQVKETMQVLAKKNEEPFEEITGETLETFHPGDSVFWRRNFARGRITRVLSSGKKAEVDFDGKILVLPFRELTRKGLRQKDTIESAGGVYVPHKPVPSSLDLRGMRVEEALNEVETYLKIVSDADLPRVYLVHGKGTGALHRAVTDFLKNSSYRKKFRPGRYGEGDQGVTVVVFDQQFDDRDFERR
jgi:DNA mismatch repair protein MutS2